MRERQPRGRTLQQRRVMADARDIAGQVEPGHSDAPRPQGSIDTG